MAAPKPTVVYRNSPQFKILSTEPDKNITNCILPNLSESQPCDTSANYSPSIDDDAADVRKPDFKLPNDDNLSPQKQISQSMKQSHFSSYTKFYSSIEDSDLLPDAVDFDVPDGFGLEFHGPLTKDDCDKRLTKDGDYLVRKSLTKKNSDLLILSLR